MRIIGGQHRSRRLQVPVGQTTRPTTDRLREALFNIVQNRMALEGCTVADIFAGTGALGLEALSRGAAHVTFVEHDRAALTALKSNIATLNETTRTSVLALDTLRLPKRSGPPCDLIFLDPPYAKGLLEQVLPVLKDQKWLAPKVLIICEQAKSEPDLTVQGFTPQDSRTYGDTRFTFLSVVGSE